jgi:predicted membrane protein
LATYLALFGAWVFSARHPDSMAWMGYLLAFPGALIGATVARSIERQKRPASTAILAGLGILCVAIGIAINQTCLCLTVMACRIG